MPKIDTIHAPASVEMESAMIPIILQLDGVAAANIQLDSAKSSLGVSLKTNYDTINAGSGLYRWFVTLPNFPRKYLVVFQDSTATSVESSQIIIEVTGADPVGISTVLESPFSDDFPGTTLNNNRWLFLVNTGGSGTYAIANSVITLTNPTEANTYTRLISKYIQGYATIYWRGVVESARQNNAGFELGCVFYNQDNPTYLLESQGLPALTGDLANHEWGWASIRFNGDATGFPLAVANSTQLVAFVTSGGQSTRTTMITIPENGRTTDSHDYGISFDGHSIHCIIDGVIMATHTNEVPPATAVFGHHDINGYTGSVAPLSNNIQVDRVDLSPDVHLCVSTKPGFPLSTHLEGKMSWENCYQDTLANGASWTGSWIDTLNYATYTVSAISSKASSANGFQIQWSKDQLNVDTTETATLQAGVDYVHNAAMPKQRYMRLQLTDAGGGGAATVRVEAILKQTGGGGTVPSNVQSDLGTSRSKSITTNNSTQVNTNTLEAGKTYTIEVIGGTGICVVVPGTVAAITDFCMYDRWVRRVTLGTSGNCFAIKRTAGSADAVVIITPEDGGAV